MATHRLPWHRVIVLFDRVYRGWYRLDAPSARIPPLLSISPERAWRSHRLPDGTLVRPGDRYGELHLDNVRVMDLRQRGLSSLQVGLQFRRELRASLATLAQLSGDTERFADLVAFSAITIFHHGLTRLGFEVEPAGLLTPRITGAYQHRLLLCLTARPGLHRSPRAERLWLSRRRLRALYGPRCHIS